MNCGNNMCVEQTIQKMCQPAPNSALDAQKAQVKAKILIEAGKIIPFVDEILGNQRPANSGTTVIHHHEPSWFWGPWFWSPRETVIINTAPSSSCPEVPVSCPETKPTNIHNGDKGTAAVVLAVATIAAAALTYSIGKSAFGVSSANDEIRDSKKFKELAEEYSKYAMTDEEIAFATTAGEAADLRIRLAGRVKSSHVGNLAINVPLMIPVLSLTPWASCSLKWAKNGVFHLIHTSSCNASTEIANKYAVPLLGAAVGLLGAKILKYGYDYFGKRKDAEALRNCVMLLTRPQLPRPIML